MDMIFFPTKTLQLDWSHRTECKVLALHVADMVPQMILWIPLGMILKYSQDPWASPEHCQVGSLIKEIKKKSMLYYKIE